MFSLILLGSVFGRTDFSRIFIFGPRVFFADFLAGFFLLIFLVKRCPEKSSRKIPGKILQNLYNKNPDTYLQRVWPNFCGSPGPFLVQQSEPFLPQNLHPREGNPLKHCLRFEQKNKTCEKIVRGKLFDSQFELFCLQLSFFAYSPLRPLLDARSHCKHKSSNCK